jgi:hypothetical protein
MKYSYLSTLAKHRLLIPQNELLASYEWNLITPPNPYVHMTNHVTISLASRAASGVDSQVPAHCTLEILASWERRR